MVGANKLAVETEMTRVTRIIHFAKQAVKATITAIASKTVTVTVTGMNALLP